MSRFGLPLVLAAALFASACAGAPVATPSPAASPSPRATPTPGTTPTPVSSPSPSPDGSPSAVVVTFDVEGERFRIRVTDRDQISHAYDLLDGAEEGRIPNGLIVRGESGVNEGWSWSIDPDSLEFADMTMEVCDGLPSHVEDGTLAGDRYCPWGAVVVDVQPAE